MKILRDRHGVHPRLALNMAIQTFAEPHPILQRLYGNPGDKLMKKADGSMCEVTLLRNFYITATEDNLESRLAKREYNSSLGFLPVQLANDSYKVYIYQVNILPE